MRLLALDAIEVSYPARRGLARVQVLAGVTVEVFTSEIICVLGRSGSGKTTLLNVAAGLQSPVSGQVHWGDIAVYDLDRTDRARWRRQHVGIVFQGGHLITTLTAAENVALSGMADGLAAPPGRARSLDLLGRVGIESRALHFPDQMSGGEQQRVAVARALFADPELLLVDEPTASLDRVTADSIVSLLVGLRSQSRGLLIATHDLKLADVADRVVRLD